MLIVLGIGSTICGMALISWGVLNQAFANIGSYAMITQEVRTIAARVTRAARGMQKITSSSATNVVLLDAQSNQVQIAYLPSLSQLTLTSNNTSIVLARDCTAASFLLYTAALSAGSWDPVAANTVAEAEALQISWTSRQNNGRNLCSYQGRTPIIGLRNR
jgi:hypothetical protein